MKPLKIKSSKTKTNKPKYKACCSSFCEESPRCEKRLECPIRAQGGCRCCCSWMDCLNFLKEIISGHRMGMGSIYFKSKKKARAYYDSLSDFYKSAEDHYRTDYAAQEIIRVEEILKEKYIRKDRGDVVMKNFEVLNKQPGVKKLMKELAKR